MFIQSVGWPEYLWSQWEAALLQGLPRDRAVQGEGRAGYLGDAEQGWPGLVWGGGVQGCGEGLFSPQCPFPKTQSCILLPGEGPWLTSVLPRISRLLRPLAPGTKLILQLWASQI